MRSKLLIPVLCAASFAGLVAAQATVLSVDQSFTHVWGVPYFTDHVATNESAFGFVTELNAVWWLEFDSASIQVKPNTVYEAKIRFKKRVNAMGTSVMVLWVNLPGGGQSSVTTAVANQPVDQWVESPILYFSTGASASSVSFGFGNYTDPTAKQNYWFDTLTLTQTHPGTGDDLTLSSTIAGGNNQASANYKEVQAGNTLNLSVQTPGYLLQDWPVYLFAQPFPSGQNPAPLLPHVWIDSSTLYFIVGGTASPFGQVVLPAAGVHVSFIIPPGLNGTSVTIQGASLSPNTQNGTYATTDAHEIRVTG